MKRGDSKVITVLGNKLAATYLGKGHYTTAYKVDNDVYLFTKNDCLKECLLHVEHENVPTIEFVEYYAGNTYDEVYKMPYYEAVRKEHTAAWKILRELMLVADKAHMELINNHPRKPYEFGYEANRYIIDNAAIPENVREGLDRMNSWAANYGSGVRFEFSPRNVGVDSKGNIIFRDCLFDSEKLYQERMASR